MKHLVLPLSALLLAACASAPEGEKRVRGAAQFSEDARLGEQTDKICFASSIDGFGKTTRDTVIVEEGRDHFLIETFGTCFNLSHAERIGFDTKGSGCLRASDKLIVSDSVFSNGDQHDFDHCTIKSIYKWDPKAETESETEDET